MPEQSADTATARLNLRPAAILRAFGHFWLEFLVGDTPEIFVGSLVVLGVTAAVAELLHVRALSVAVLPVLVIGLLAASLGWAKRRVKPPDH